MTPRLLPALLSCVLLGGDAPTSDPFLAVLEGRGIAPLPAPPGSDPLRDAVSWSTRPRREIVDGLAALLLRGGSGGTASPGAGTLVVPPARIPAGFDPDGVPVTDRLASWVPADAAAVFFPSLREAEALTERLAGSLPGAFPALCGDGPSGRRDALRRALGSLLLPTIWQANPGVRTGTRQVAFVASDPDLRGAPDVAFLCEVDDASLVLAHRRATFRWEERHAARLRVDGLDATTDDGAVRSFFALEGGTAVFATSRTLRERVLAAGAGRTPSMLRPDPSAWALARSTFPAAEGGALLVVPDAFLARASAAGMRLRRAAALRCGAVRLLADARSLRGGKDSPYDTVVLSCPSGGESFPRAGKTGTLCTVHGTAASPTPLGDLPEPSPDPAAEAALARVDPALDPVLAGAVPVAARYRLPAEGPGTLEILVPPAPAGVALLRALENRFSTRNRVSPPDAQAVLDRLRALLSCTVSGGEAGEALVRLSGLAPPPEPVERPPFDRSEDVSGWWITTLPGTLPTVPDPREGGGVLRIPLAAPRWAAGTSTGSARSFVYGALPMEWR